VAEFLNRTESRSTAVIFVLNANKFNVCSPYFKKRTVTCESRDFEVEYLDFLFRIFTASGSILDILPHKKKSASCFLWVRNSLFLFVITGAYVYGGEGKLSIRLAWEQGGDHTSGSELFWPCKAGGEGTEIKLGMNVWKRRICLWQQVQATQC